MSQSDDLHHYHYGYPHMSPGDQRRHQAWCEHYEKGGICNHYGRCIGSSQCRLYKKIDNGTPDPFENDDTASDNPQHYEFPAVFTPRILQIIAEKERIVKAKREAEEQKRLEQEKKRNAVNQPPKHIPEKKPVPQATSLDEEIKQAIIQNNVRLWRISHHKPVK